MKRLIILIITFVGISMFAMQPHFMFDPAISPDGEEVCFVFHDRLWTVDWEGGVAHSLTSVDVGIYSPQYSPDGRSIAYMTSREGYQCIFTIPSEGGEAKAVSQDNFVLCDWYPDGKSLLVTRYQEKYHDEYFRLQLDGKYQKITSFSGSFSSLDKKAERIIFCQRGYPYREKYTGSANGDLWIYDIKKDEYNRLTETDYTERYPQFSWNKDRIYFGGSDGEIFQLYQVDGLDFGNKKQLTNFDEWSIRDLDVAHDNERIVFEHFDQLYKYDPEKRGKKAVPLEIEIKEDIIPNSLTKEKYHNSFDTFDVSEDGKLVVFSWKYDLFAMPAEGGEVKQITFDQKGIDDIEIMADNKTVIFTKLIKGMPQLFKFNILEMDKVEKIKWSEDRYIDYLDKQGKNLVIGFSTANKRFRKTAIADSVGEHIKILPVDDRVDFGVLDDEGRYFMYIVTDFKVWNREIKIYDTETKETFSVEKSTSWFSSLVWGKDKQSAFYSKSGDIYRLDLKAKPDYFYAEEDKWEDILKVEEPKKSADKEDEKEAKPEDDGWQIDFEHLDERSTPIVTAEGNNYVASLTEDLIYYLNENDNKMTLRKIKYNGEDDEEVKSLPGKINDIYLRNNKWYYVSGNSLYEMPLSGGKAEKVENEFKYEYDQLQLNHDVFDQVWLRFGRGFYDPEMHDLNWDKIYKKYQPYLKYAYKPSILGNIVDEMIGEVNASHTGFYPRREATYQRISSARLGAVMQMEDFPKKGIRFKKVYRNSSLAEDHKIKSGDILLSIDGIEVGKNLPFDDLLRDKVGEKIELEIDMGDSTKTVEIKGLPYRDVYQLWYEDWVAARRDKVDKLSGGKIAYSHIEGMDMKSYERFEDELFSLNFDKDALIIDVRFNGGGHTHEEILETLTRKQYGWSSSRYADAVPYPTPRNIWDKPIILLIDEDSFSDAEIFPILFKNLKLGKVIGMPTSGSVIGTGHINFMDGSSMRMPSSGWFEMDHANMEGVGAAPDIYVPMTPKDYINDNDVQLQRAVEELLKEL